jgi:hypothetical protein
MDTIHVHVEREGEHVKVRGMTTYEWCMKTNVVLNPPYTK